MAFTMTFNRAFAYPARGQSAVQAEWRRLNATKNLLKLYWRALSFGCLARSRPLALKGDSYRLRGKDLDARPPRTTG
jgi:hypothetical protein